MNREIWRGWTAFVCAVAAVIASFVCAAQVAAQSTTTQVEIDLPSASTGSTGGTLAVRIFAPATSGRYTDGAPVVIYAPGGEDVGTLDEVLRPATDVIRIVFLYPGGRDLRSGRASSGTYDYRGERSIAALRDVILYAAGLLTDSLGRNIDSVVPVRVAHRNIGLFGSSNGGNMVVAVSAQHGTEFNRFVRYIVQWESPVSSQVAVGDIGPTRLDCTSSGLSSPSLQNNPWYNPLGYTMTALAVDYSRLRYNPLDRTHPVFLDGNGDGRYTTIPDRANRGCFTPDLNGDGVLATNEDRPLNAYRDGTKAVYSRQATQAMAVRGIFSTWPSNIATVTEAEAFWNLREAVRLYDNAVANIPDIEGMFLCSLTDHVQTAAPDKPHVHQGFDGLNSRGRWVKINPARSSIIAVDARLSSRTDIPDNTANVAPSWNNPASYAYPDDIEAAAQAAAVQEMADRAHTRDASPSSGGSSGSGAGGSSGGGAASVTAKQDNVIFSINVQDFSYPDKSIATVYRILDLHERYGVPVDVYLTTTMTDLFEHQAPDLLQRLRASSRAAVSYHVRPPKPYYTGFDWAGLGAQNAQEQYLCARRITAPVPMTMRTACGDPGVRRNGQRTIPMAT